MTDKSFGDHMNRNIVKNPLLSTAVTGLSIEDLTHNAVLLPVSLSQDLITRPDQQTGSQSRTLQQHEHAVSNYPSGDTNSNPISLNQPHNPPTNFTTPPRDIKSEKDSDKLRSTVSKASVKSDDDFDVNEYFARLHGTRYVSAPINSVLKEDKNANLEETEGNLEEINLNEPEKDVQQSLTADIAQNFSQLPTVLPQMASAVFSSFSNMLQTRKSREPTPDGVKAGGYQEVQFERPSVPVAEFGKDVAPPPKEPLTMPPTVGTANYRLPPKKKYAQIPGLSSGDCAPSPYQNMPLMTQNMPPLGLNMPPSSPHMPPLSQTMPVNQTPQIPQYFVPNMNVDAQNPQFSTEPEKSIENPILHNVGNQSNVPSHFIPDTSQYNQPNEAVDFTNPVESQTPQQMVDITKTSDRIDVNKPRVTAQNIPVDKTSSQPSQIELNYFGEQKTSQTVPPTHSYNTDTSVGSQVANSVLPPPPMFANVPRKDSLSAGKSILPPSVARRISAKQPSNQTPPVPSFTENIFTPVMPESTADKTSQDASGLVTAQPQSTQSAFTPFNQPSTSPAMNFPPQGPIGLQNLPPPPKSVPIVPQAEEKNVAQTFTQPSISPSSVATGLNQQSSGLKQATVSPSIFTPMSVPASSSSVAINNPQLKPLESSVPPLMFPPNNAQAFSEPPAVPPTLFTPTGVPMTSVSQMPPTVPSVFNPTSQVAPPAFFNPTATPAQNNEYPPTDIQTRLPIVQSTPEPPKPVPEPPKASGAVNFRMTKKRPQYYAGPIEGVGAISNNVKPVIAPVDTGSFQGALFTPQASNTVTPVAPTEQSVPFDISRPTAPSYAPFELNQPQQQMPQYNTAFDMSRPITETYNEPSKQESSGFGLFGSLKSKLSSIDINKIQNSVTTFFDPGYNETRKDATGVQDNVTYGQQQFTPYAQQHYGPSQSSNFEIFVPTGEQPAPGSNQAYNYQTPNQKQYSYDQENQNFYQNQDTYNYYQNTAPSVGDYYTGANYQTNVNAAVTYQPISTGNVQHQQTVGQGNTDLRQGHGQQHLDSNVLPDSALPPQYSQDNLKPYIPTATHPTIPMNIPESQPAAQNIGQTQAEATAKNFFDPVQNLLSQNKENVPGTVPTVQSTLNTQNSALDNLNTSAKSFFDSRQENPPLTETNTSVNVLETSRSSSEKAEIGFTVPTSMFSSLQLNVGLNAPQRAFKTGESISNTQHVGQIIAPIGTDSSAKNLFDSTHSDLLQILKQGDAQVDISPSNQTNIIEKAINRDAAASFFSTPPVNPQAHSGIQSEQLKSNPEDSTPRDKTEDKESKIQEETKGTDVQKIMFNIQDNAVDFFGCLSGNRMHPDGGLFSNFSLASDNQSDVFQELARSAEVLKENMCKDSPQLDISSTALFGLSNMLADKTKELKDLQDEMKSMSIHETPKEDEEFNPTTDASFENRESPDDNIGDDDGLNICETCREVNKPEEKENELIDDLTTQLIENITSPIQLLNPVEVPLTEASPVVTDVTDFDTSQCEEISHITEETIETIQVQSATELLDDEQLTIRPYGWSTDDVQYSPKTHEDRNYTLPYQTKSSEHNYNLPIHPDSIGLFGSDTVTANVAKANDEIKAEYNMSQKDTPIVLPRQMSIPTAPPEEDDTKSEGIDVHSIEQDANKDFPLFEEFVIEPSADDDKDDEEHSADKVRDLDSFTSRVDKFQKKDEVDVFDKTSPVFGVKSAPSPSIHMASYFDTGNYAVETHYRNSLTSPNVMRIPPGFEEEFQRRLSAHNIHRNDVPPPSIPETSTQTKFTYSPTFSMAQNVTDFATCVTTSLASGYVDKAIEREKKLPDFATAFGIKAIIEDMSTDTVKISSVDEPDVKPCPTIELEKPIESENTPALANIFGAKTDEVTRQIPLFEKPKVDPKIQSQPLPDPINFFGASVENVEKPDKNDNQFNRLASYFSAPAKADHSKTFFELSQSQNHYRQPSKTSDGLSSTNIKPDNNPIQSINANIFNIPQEQYLANLNLMHDLTSVQNAEFKPETVVRTVNYFTIEYDNANLVKDLNKGEPDYKKEKQDDDFDSDLETSRDDKTLRNIINRCKHCCNLTAGHVRKLDNINHDVLTDFKVRKCMDGNSEAKKDNIMEGVKECDTRTSVAVNFDSSADEETNEGVTMMTENRSSMEYSPVKHHWFYRVDVDSKSTWRGFSVNDSRALEEAFNSPNLSEDTLVATDGGRYDVNVTGRLRFPVYWTDKPTNVRRCSWFYKGTTDARYVPYTETVAEKLEEEYRHGMTTGEWHRRLVLPNNEMVVMHGPAVMVHFLQGSATDAFSAPPLPQIFAFGKRVYRNPPKIRVSRDQPEKIDHLVMLVHGAGEYRHQKEKIQSTMRPRVVRRGYDESEIEEVEPSSIDHLLLLCHGVGSACDMRFRSVEEVVDDFRTTSLQLIQSHYKNSFDSGVVGRVEVLPISWHATLHSGETGVDRRLARITLDSIPRLRNFTNDTVLDVLFYTSPVFCQTIINTVCLELNRIYALFCARNPGFQGGVSLGGHSLGSVILYDLLCHQSPPPPQPGIGSKRYVSGAAGTGQPAVQYPALDFKPTALYALGSPIAIFECIRGVDSLGMDFSLPTCKNFFNIFHPYDPIAYRIEPLINPQLRDVKPSLIPHHKGRKRMHLELKDTMARVGADIKQKLIESIKSTWSSMWKTQPPPTDRQLEKVVEEEMEKEQIGDDKEEMTNEVTPPELLGQLNSGRRVDYVLQEAPFEMINEYLFAMSSHVCYWESEDTMLLMLREIYSGLGVQPDCCLPQHSLTLQRTRLPTPEEALVMSSSEHPSTSRGTT